MHRSYQSGLPAHNTSANPVNGMILRRDACYFTFTFASVHRFR